MPRPGSRDCHLLVPECISRRYYTNSYPIDQLYVFDTRLRHCEWVLWHIHLYHANCHVSWCSSEIWCWGSEHLQSFRPVRLYNPQSLVCELNGWLSWSSFCAMCRSYTDIPVSIDGLTYLQEIATTHVYPAHYLSLYYSSDPVSPPSQCQYFSTSGLEPGWPVSFLPCRSANIFAEFQCHFVHIAGG